MEEQILFFKIVAFVNFIGLGINIILLVKLLYLYKKLWPKDEESE